MNQGDEENYTQKTIIISNLNIHILRKVLKENLEDRQDI